MSFSTRGFSSWRKSTPTSTNSQPDDHNREGSEAFSPSQASDMPIASSRMRSSSISSVQGHREPIRSFIHGSVRDNLSRILASHQVAWLDVLTRL